VAQAFQLTGTSCTTNLGCYDVKSLVYWSDSWTRFRIRSHLNGTYKPSVGMVPKVVIYLDRTGRVTTKYNMVWITTKSYIASESLAIYPQAGRP
jgi:hypothetical protein